MSAGDNCYKQAKKAMMWLAPAKIQAATTLSVQVAGLFLILNPGHAGEQVAVMMSKRIQQLDVAVETKTRVSAAAAGITLAVPHVRVLTALCSAFCRIMFSSLWWCPSNFRWA